MLQPPIRPQFCAQLLGGVSGKKVLRCHTTQVGQAPLFPSCACLTHTRGAFPGKQILYTRTKNGYAIWRCSSFSIAPHWPVHVSICDAPAWAALC
jgi:hypothetical protein